MLEAVLPLTLAFEADSKRPSHLSEGVEDGRLALLQWTSRSILEPSNWGGHGGRGSLGCAAPGWTRAGGCLPDSAPCARACRVQRAPGGMCAVRLARRLGWPGRPAEPLEAKAAGSAGPAGPEGEAA